MFTIRNHLPSLNIAENFCSLGSLHDLNPQTAAELPLVHPIKKICSVTFISRIVCCALRFFFWSLINNLKYLNNTILYSVQRTYELSQSSAWEYAWSEKFTVRIKMKFRLVINLRDIASVTNKVQSVNCTSVLIFTNTLNYFVFTLVQWLANTYFYFYLYPYKYINFNYDVSFLVTI